MTNPGDYVFPINEVIIEAFATGPPGPIGLTGPQGETGPQGPPGGFNWYVSVKDFGATGDGSTDDTVAIQNAINTAVAQGLKAVFFPSGTYIVSQDEDGYVLIMQQPNFTLFGSSRDVATIKMKNNAGDYVAMLSDGVSSGFYDLSGMVIRDLSWDQNSDGNPILDASVTGPLFNGFPRFAIRMYNGSYGSIYNCRFKNTDCVNTIAMNGTVVGQTGWWSVHHNQFDYVGFGAYHDHSTIYWHGEGIRIHDNFFVGGGNAAITAIETHGPGQHVTNNYVKQYYCMANITGVHSEPSKNIVVTGNTGEGMGSGIALWAFDYGGLSGYALDGCIVSENEIEVDYDRWSDVVAYRNGILLYPTSTALCRNVKIKDNIIRYAAHSDPPVSNDNQSSGIAWQRTVTPTEGTEEVDIEITGNTITGPLGPGIQYVPKILSKRIKIKDNNVNDPGDGCPDPTYALGILLNNAANGTQNIDASNNKFVDTRTPHKIVYGLNAVGTTVVDNARATENFVWCADAARVPVQIVHSSTPWNLGAIAGTFHQRYATGRYYTQPAQARTTLAMTQDVLYLCKFIVGFSHTFDRIGANVTVTPGTTNLRFGVWADNGRDAPGALLYDTGTVSAATTGFKEATVSYPLYANVYWLGVVAQSGTATITAMNVGVHSVGHATATNLITSDYSGLIANGPFAGALTASPAINNYAAFGPLILLRA